MNAATPKAPVTNGAHAGLAIARVHDGRSTIGVMIMVLVLTKAVAATVGSPARIMVPANGLTVHGQDDRAKGGCIGVAGWNNRGLIRHRIGRRRLAFSAIPGGRS
jgi:hypothetical protein